MIRRTRLHRRGAIVPLMAICLTGLMAFVALALDLGILMVARNQCQNAADSAAMAGARTLTGDTTTNNNYSAAQPAANAAAYNNSILNQPIVASQVTTTVGDYYYDTASASFKINPTALGKVGDNWTLVQATVTSQQPTYFAKVFGMTTLNATATGSAAHRPRDTSIVVDFSGSMRFESLLASPYFGARTVSMNPNTVYPQFGAYSGNSALLTYSTDQTASGGEDIGAANLEVVTTDSNASVISGFYGDTTAFGTSTPAFTSASAAYATTPGGDAPLTVTKNTTGGAYAKTVKDVTGATTRDGGFELDGYSAYAGGGTNTNTSTASDYTNAPFNGYTQGPGYWGKTFYAWPPDPRVGLTLMAPIGCTSASYTAAQIKNIVIQSLSDTVYGVAGYTAGDFSNTSVFTNLKANINNSTTTITVNSAANFPTTATVAAPFKIMVGTAVANGTFSGSPEIMYVTGLAGTTWTVQRGKDSNGPFGFTSGAGIGLVTGAPLAGIYTAPSTNLPLIGITPTGSAPTPVASSLWTSWTAATLGTYLTSNVYKPGSGVRLTATDPEYLQHLRLFNRNGGPGMPTDGAPNPVPCDWRARFFTTPAGAPMMDDSKLWSGGTMAVPSSTTYLINYAAILDWITNSGVNPFPNQLRAGGIVYYTAIPNTINTGTFPPTDPNQRFWKEYIDEVLGFMQTGGSGSNPTYADVSASNGYGADFAWGTVQTTGQPGSWPTSNYINYTDNPNRPLLRFWFGPLTMVDYLGNYNASDPSNNGGPRLWWPGTVSEAPTYQTKLGIQAALKDIFLNHPNDNVSITFFSSPRSSAGATGYYNTVPAPLGRDERHMINSLWFSPKTISTNAEINLYNSSGVNTGDIYTVPRANGGTCYAMPLMLAYNQFSSNPALLNYTANAPVGTAGGLGRNGASKLLVFETDGMVNTGAASTLVSSSNGQGYYKVRIADVNNLSAGGTEFPTGVTGVSFSTGATQSQTIATQICANLSAGGFSTTRKPVLIHSIAFGSLFNASNGSSNKTNALQNLATLEVIGSVQTAGATTLAPNKIITGPFQTRIDNLQAAFTGIMQDGVQVTLIPSRAGAP
jgi:Flp pilus assembly protein TadG